MLSILNPNRKSGHITLITRLGVNHIPQCLPPLIHAVHQHQQPVIWMCDPMHGNTKFTESKIKTRYFDDIINDLKMTVAVHQRMNSYLSGLHLEICSEPITECIGGATTHVVDDLTKNYRTLVDPRLNSQQALALVESFQAMKTSSSEHFFYDPLVSNYDLRLFTS